LFRKATVRYNAGIVFKFILRSYRLATHGRCEIAWVLGSVAEQVVSHAMVPVLLMRVLKGQPLMKKEYLMSGP
jgi:hypothetical protein